MFYDIIIKYEDGKDVVYAKVKKFARIKDAPLVEQCICETVKNLQEIEEIQQAVFVHALQGVKQTKHWNL